jgi:hypothetical protein
MRRSVVILCLGVLAVWNACFIILWSTRWPDATLGVAMLASPFTLYSLQLVPIYFLLRELCPAPDGHLNSQGATASLLYFLAVGAACLFASCMAPGLLVRKVVAFIASVALIVGTIVGIRTQMPLRWLHLLLLFFVCALAMSLVERVDDVANFYALIHILISCSIGATSWIRHALLTRRSSTS